MNQATTILTCSVGGVFFAESFVAKIEEDNFYANP